MTIWFRRPLRGREFEPKLLWKSGQPPYLATTSNPPPWGYVKGRLIDQRPIVMSMDISEDKDETSFPGRVLPLPRR